MYSDVDLILLNQRKQLAGVALEFFACVDVVEKGWTEDFNVFGGEAGDG